MLLNRKSGFAVLSLLLAALSMLAQSEELAPFTSDGCSALVVLRICRPHSDGGMASPIRGATKNSRLKSLKRLKG